MIGEFKPAEASFKAHVIYHGKCNDGFGAAWAFNKLSPYSTVDTTYEEGVYGRPPALTDINYPAKHDLWILDFSYPWNTLVDLASKFNQVVVIDHHKTFIDSLDETQSGEYNIPSNLCIVYDLDRSGAGLTWDYLRELNFSGSSTLKRPPLIDYIEDRDLWKFKFYKSQLINAVIAATPKTFLDYTDLHRSLRDDLSHTIQVGQYLKAQHDQIVEDIVASARKITIYGVDAKQCDGLLANATGHFASDVGNILAGKSGTFGGTYIAEANGDTKFSLRSIGDYDVSAICKAYGGGGHKNAAGFSLKNPMPEAGGVIIWMEETPKQAGDIMLPQGGM